MDKSVDVAIIGAGSAGLTITSQVRKANKSFALINGGHLGTTCARVGCMPSKAFIQVAEDFHRRTIFERHAIEGGDGLHLDMEDAMEHVRDLRDVFVDRVLGNTTDEMGDELIEGYAEFIAPDTLRVGDDVIHADKIVIATGSRPIKPGAWDKYGDRILTTDDFFEQDTFPASMAIIGLGVIGLELGQALNRLGVEVTGIDQAETIAGLTDPVVSRVAIDTLSKEFPIWLGAPADIEDAGDQLRVSAGDNSVSVDKVLVCIGRVPNFEGLGLEKLDIEFSENGVPAFNPNTMQVGQLPLFIAGDVTATNPILHEANDEGRIAGYNAAHNEVIAFQRKTHMAITFCDPNIITVGACWHELETRDDVIVGEMPMGPVGRALIMAKNKGIIRVYAEKQAGRILGAAICSTKGENLAHLLAWAIQQNLTVLDLIRMPFYHPTIEEGLQAALYSLLGKLDTTPPALPELVPLR